MCQTAHHRHILRHRLLNPAVRRHMASSGLALLTCTNRLETCWIQRRTSTGFVDAVTFKGGLKLTGNSNYGTTSLSHLQTWMLINGVERAWTGKRGSMASATTFHPTQRFKMGGTMGIEFLVVLYRRKKLFVSSNLSRHWRCNCVGKFKALERISLNNNGERDATSKERGCYALEKRKCRHRLVKFLRKWIFERHYRMCGNPRQCYVELWRPETSVTSLHS